MSDDTGHGQPIYSSEDVDKIASIFGMDKTDVEAMGRLTEALKNAAAQYSMRIDWTVTEKPRLPPTKLHPQLNGLANSIEKSMKTIRLLPRNASSDLRSTADELALARDEFDLQYKGRPPTSRSPNGAKRLHDAIDEAAWIVACLRALEARTRSLSLDKGGNRKDEDRAWFFDRLNEIISEFYKDLLVRRVDRFSGEETGSLNDFLKICFKPFPMPISASSLARAFERHTRT